MGQALLLIPAKLIPTKTICREGRYIVLLFAEGMEGILMRGGELIQPCLPPNPFSLL